MTEFKKDIEELNGVIEELRLLLKVEEKRPKISAIQALMSKPGFWDDANHASSVVSELKEVKADVDDWDELRKKIADISDFYLLDDAAIKAQLDNEAVLLRQECRRLRLRLLFSGKHDSACAIMEINSGAGGTEACDWASMLFRMYLRWAENKRFAVKILQELRGEEAGIKSATFTIEGRRAYGLLRSERGVHRLVRISPFDSNKRRHTSFASVDVLPDIKDDSEIQIRPEEIRVDTYRSSGAGGQHVNVTDSAVRITHISTGIIVSCQNERSQHQNKFSALQILRAKLYKIKEDESKKELEGMVGQKRRIEWGSQIRSYVLHPYLMVKDHRTSLEEHDARKVLDGEIDDFIYAYLEHEAKGNG